MQADHNFFLCFINEFLIDFPVFFYKKLREKTKVFFIFK